MNDLRKTGDHFYMKTPHLTGRGQDAASLFIQQITCILWGKGVHGAGIGSLKQHDSHSEQLRRIEGSCVV